MNLNRNESLDNLDYTSKSMYSMGITEPHGRIFLSGQQALVRLLLTQAAADRLAGLSTAGFVSGYRGSPLGGFDRELWKAQDILKQSDIRFLPAINEDLAATSLIGTQRVETDDKRKFDGVFGMWYGKGPGLDRSGDAIKHGNAYGSSPHGGVLVVTGDDHGCVSSSMSHQSDRTLIAWGLPVIHPSGIEDFEKCGLWGWALSRLSGLWVGFKAITETVEAAVSIETEDIPKFIHPAVDTGPDGLHWRWPDLPGMQIERRINYKYKAAHAFIKVNPLDMVLSEPSEPVYAIAAVGKAYLDVREVFRRCGVTFKQLEEAGIVLLKINLVYPLSPLLEEWSKKVKTVLVIEEKEPVVEEQLKQVLYNLKNESRATVIGKTDENNVPLISNREEIHPSEIASIIMNRIGKHGISYKIPESWVSPPQLNLQKLIKRTPYFCSGCPHNTSTQLPKGSEARLGIGCHALAARIPERKTTGSVQMGGEGVDWIGQAPFVDTKHIFQNIGDGTFFHSGYLAIRQAIASGSNITYKLLHNDAVAMTGGQPIDGKMNVVTAAELVKKEGAQRVVVVTDDLKRYKNRTRCLPKGIELYHRDRLHDIQSELRKTPGVSVLIYDQLCAIEKRRRNKQHKVSDIVSRVVINKDVCEGCGDCQTESNCLSVVSVDTSLGSKRSIDMYTCNQDMTCIKGYCPSFITITGKHDTSALKVIDNSQALQKEASLELPSQLFDTTTKPYELLMVGEGGTGIMTVANLIGLAAKFDGNAVSVLDFTGFAQKGGVVRSYIRIARNQEELNQYRIDRASADVLLASDLIGASENDVLTALKQKNTIVIANTNHSQTGSMLRDVNLSVEDNELQDVLRNIVGEENFQSFDAKLLAQELLDPMQTNMMLLGYLWQKGTLPLTLNSLENAFAVQGGVASKRLAFTWGRLWANAPYFVAQFIEKKNTDNQQTNNTIICNEKSYGNKLNKIIEFRVELLKGYQNKQYAERYREIVEQVKFASKPLNESVLAEAVAINLYKLMAYKDEYEVARLLSSNAFLTDIRKGYKKGAKITFHFTLPVFRLFNNSNKRQSKVSVSNWMIPMLKLLSKGRFLRQTCIDPFGWAKDRRKERDLIREYVETLTLLLPKLTHQNQHLFVSWARLPESIRGFGVVKKQSMVAAHRLQIHYVNQILNDEPSNLNSYAETLVKSG